MRDGIHSYVRGSAALRSRKKGARTWIFLRALLILSIMGGALGCQSNKQHGGPGNPSASKCSPPSKQELPVDFIAQGADYWCWAASGEMVMKTRGKDVTQCDQANHRFKQESCCKSPTSDACNKGGWPEFDYYQFPSLQPTACQTAISWDQLKEQIACKKSPIAFAWLWSGKPSEDCMSGNGHMMVVRGYSEMPNKRLVLIDDPTVDEDERQPTEITYEEFAGSEPTHSHWRDFYDVYK